MALDLAVYEDTKHIIAHTLTCPTIGSVARKYQSSLMVRVEPEWVVYRCDRCKPDVMVVEVETARVNQKPGGGNNGWHSTPPPPENPYGPTNYSTSHSMSEWKGVVHRKNPDSSYPPYGTVALDITHSDNKRHWWTEAECLSDDERLGDWLTWLYTTELTAHWTLTVQKVLCWQCPVRAECLEQGVWGREEWGVWGGATVQERKELLKKWLREGRVDERTSRPGSLVRREDGSGVTDSHRDNGRGVGEGTRAREETGEDLYEMPAESESRVHWPRTYGRSTGYQGESIGSW